MSINTIITVTGSIVAIISILYALRLFNSGDNKETAIKAENTEDWQPARADIPKLRPMPTTAKMTREEQEITFAALSDIWTAHMLKECHFEELATIWRNIEPKEAKMERQITFNHEEINEFFEKYVKGKPFYEGEAFDAVVDVLELLDKYGDCPSVVNKHKDEVERSSEPSTYALLEKLPLYLHSLHVAEEMIATAERGIMIPKFTIAALCHDIGKFPEQYLKNYKTGTHAYSSMCMMETMETLRCLVFYDDIKEAVKNHHIQSEAFLESRIRECDQRARRREIKELEEVVIEEEATKEAPPAAKSAEPPSVEKKQEDDHIQENETDIFGNSAQTGTLTGSETKQKSRAKRKIVDISAWFNADRFLVDIANSINYAFRPEKYWSVLELNGYVYIKPDGLWELIKDHSFGNPQVKAAAFDETTRDDIRYTVVCELAKKGALATNFVREGYFGAVFRHKMASGKEAELYLTPLKAEIFGDEIFQKDKRRTETMKNTVSLTAKVWKSKGTGGEDGCE